MLKLSDPVNKLHLINASSFKGLKRLGIETIEDLLWYFPKRWQDLRNILKIEEVKVGEEAVIQGTVMSIKSIKPRWKKLHIIEAKISDETGEIDAVWFNQPFITRQLVKGGSFYFHGKAKLYKKQLQLQSPKFEAVKEDTLHTAGIIPEYKLTAGITQKMIRYWIRQALPSTKQIQEHLPESILKRLKYPKLSVAIHSTHSPDDEAVLEKSIERLEFDELFLFQLSFLMYKKKLQKLPAPVIKFDQELIKSFVSSLPFELTNSQRTAVWEILKDLEKPHPMNRMLEGDVGSGKTVVAGVAMLETANQGYQSVLLAPTEILAVQHYETLKEMFPNAENLAIYTQNHKNATLDDLRNGKKKIIIGTHALLQKGIKLNNLGLLIVDEQHRFGVKQRGKLQKSKKTEVPHFLSMTATPIPRSLALSIYGDLDISQLKQVPKGRKPIITKLVAETNREKAYEYIRDLIKNKNQQAYVVTPLIEDSDKLGVKSATSESQKLQQQIFPELKIGTLHGKLKADEKTKIMDAFKKGDLDILVSTTVIEVGVDVPNATIMIIENAERFGLAQLHQLRGRVGRSDKQSFCFLFTSSDDELTHERLSALVENSSGFDLAEKDLELRGPGEILGDKQSGFNPFKIANLTNKKLIKLAEREAKKLIEVDPKIASSPLLKLKLLELMKNIHLE